MKVSDFSEAAKNYTNPETTEGDSRNGAQEAPEIDIEDAFGTIRQEIREREERRRRGHIVYWSVFAAVVAAVIVLRIWFYAPVVVYGESMCPTYDSGDILLTAHARNVKEINVNDIAVVENGFTRGNSYIKRVEGVPGDTLYIEDGVLYRNGEPLDEGFELIQDPGCLEEPLTLGEDEYFVMGDNRNNSTDSRVIGIIQREEIQYIVLCRLWHGNFPS